MPLTRASFVVEVIDLIHTPYLWKGKTPMGADCSGVVTYARWKAGGPDDRLKIWTDFIWNEWPAVKKADAQPGELYLYGGKGPKDVEHVMVLVSPGVLVGACGGDSTSTDIEISRIRGHRVRAFTFEQYAKRRSDFRGIRALPEFV